MCARIRSSRNKCCSGDREPRIRLAAKKFEKAAARYRRAGLGLLAKEKSCGRFFDVPYESRKGGNA